jgi:alanyl-tRNA synthetase
MSNTPWTSQKIRQTFFDYFSESGHAQVPSSSLIPGNDATLLFTNAGMVQFKEVFLGLDKRSYTRAVSAQRCMRAGGKHNDLENVGYTARHHTFFEMLGNFSFGNYFKREAIQYAWHFLTGILQLPAEKLWITVYESDQETAKIWLDEIGVNPKQFSYCGAKDNFWSMGDTGPCGPCTEIFYDHGASIAGGPPGSPEEDGDRYVEIWNLVFMEFNRTADGQLASLPKPSVDTGMGLERLAAVMQGAHNNYDTDLFIPIIEAIVKLAGLSNDTNTSVRVIADHIRSCAFLIADGVIPSNEGRGYVLRRIIRRAVRHGHHLNLNEPFFYQLVAPLIEVMGNAYPELKTARTLIESTLLQEEQQFVKTLEQGFKLFNQATTHLTNNLIPGETVFKLYDTYGFPIDLTADIARERGLSIDEEGFEREMAKQRQQSQAKSQFHTDYSNNLSTNEETVFTGYEYLEQDAQITALFVDQKPVETMLEGQTGIIVLDSTPFYPESGGQIGDQGFLQAKTGWFEVENTQKKGQTILHMGKVKGGQLQRHDNVQAKVDTLKRHATALNHSATHLLNAALKKVLGNHVQQKGSLVEPQRLRFDFTHFSPLTDAEIRETENLINVQIRKNHAAHTDIMEIEEAINSGATAIFGEKYGDKVRVLSLGNFSKELCGGTHVQRTGDIGLCKIISETGIAAGVRRIEAITGQYAMEWVEKNAAQLHQIAALLKTESTTMLEKLQQLIMENRRLEKLTEQLQAKLAHQLSNELVSQARIIHHVQVLSAQLPAADVKALRTTLDQLKQTLSPAVIVLACKHEGKVHFVSGVTINDLHAGELAQFIGTQIGGKGGGRRDMAQGGGDKPEHLEEALASVYGWVEERMYRP